MPSRTTSDVPARPRAASNAKRAAQVADQIVADVMALGWPVGAVLGSEADLLQRYGVSRAVLREAVRLIEHQQVARTRRGPGGGLVITEPTVEAVIDAVVLYLHRVDARLDEVFEARLVLEELSIELATTRLQDHDIAQLREYVDQDHPQLGEDPRALHALIASMSGNPALELFVDVLNRVSMLYSRGWQNFGATAGTDMAHAHSRIAGAVIAGEPVTASRLMRKHLDAEAEYLRRRRSTRQLLPDDVVLGPDNSKRAEAVARHITQLLADDGIEPGGLVGSETDLIQREGVSRAVFREAVRLLEHHHIASMRRGPGGGLFVMTPNVGAVTDIAAIYLARRGIRLSDLAELRRGVEAALAGLAASRIDDDGVGRLRHALEHEASSSDTERAEAVHDLHAAVATVAANRALELVALVLIRLSRLHQIERLAPKARKEIRAEVLRTHEGIAAAVESGDADQARRRMRRHLDALGAVITAG